MKIKRIQFDDLVVGQRFFTNYETKYQAEYEKIEPLRALDRRFQRLILNARNVETGEMVAIMGEDHMVVVEKVIG